MHLLHHRHPRSSLVTFFLFRSPRFLVGPIKSLELHSAPFHHSLSITWAATQTDALPEEALYRWTSFIEYDRHHFGVIESLGREVQILQG